MIGGGLANETGFTGEGMLIAILDTGVDMDHQIFSKAPANPALTQDAVKDLLSQYDFQAEGIVKGLSVSSVYKSAKFPFQFDYGDKDTDGAPAPRAAMVPMWPPPPPAAPASMRTCRVWPRTPRSPT